MKPRIRVKVRKATMIQIGGVMALVEGYDKAACYTLGRLFQRGNVFKIDRIGRSGDYDKYRVIHD